MTDDLHRFSSSNQQQSLHLLNNVNNKPVSKALQSTQIKPKKLFPRIKIITWYKWHQLAKKFHTLMTTFSARFPTLFHKPGNHMNQFYATQCSKSPEALKQRRISLVCPWFSDVQPQAANNKVYMKVVYQKETKIFHAAILLPCQWASVIPGLLWDCTKLRLNCNHAGKSWSTVTWQKFFHDIIRRANVLQTTRASGKFADLLDFTYCVPMPLVNALCSNKYPWYT